MESFPSDLATTFGGLEVTEVCIRKTSSPGRRTLGLYAVTFNSCFKVNGLELRTTRAGDIEMIMPHQINELQPRLRIDYAHPVKLELHELLEDLLIWCHEHNKVSKEIRFIKS
mgnify:CR=1 FL=1